MNFFGLTYLGPNGGNNLLKSLNVQNFTDEDFALAFDQEDTAKKGTLETFQFKHVFSRVYGGEPPECEISFLLEGCKVLSDAIVTKEQFMAGITALREATAQREENTATEFKSNLAYQDAIHKHTRLQYDPKEKFRTPELSSQDYGWSQQTKVEQIDRKPKKNCDETVYAAEMIKTGIYF